MKKFILAMAILAMAVSVSAAPFLVCDDPPAEELVTSYEMFQDGVSLGIVAAPLYFDLGTITPGQYSFTATVINAWGSSSPSNPYVSPASATQPSNINMIP